MARARNIKPALFKNEILGVADPLLTLLFEGLWLLADRAGRLEDRPMRIKAEIFPYREGLDLPALLDWLSENGFIIRYMSRGNRYIQIISFEKHQNPHKNEPESEIPAYTGTCDSTDKIGTSTDKIGTAPADSLNLIPDSLTTETPTPAKPEPAGHGDTKRSSTLRASDLVSLLVDQNVAEGFLAIRKAKRSPLTRAAIDAITKEAQSAGMTLNAALTECCARGWQGFKAEWMPASSRHAGFDRVDYTKGVDENGRF